MLDLVTVGNTKATEKEGTMAQAFDVGAFKV